MPPPMYPACFWLLVFTQALTCWVTYQISKRETDLRAQIKVMSHAFHDRHRAMRERVENMADEIEHLENLVRGSQKRLTNPKHATPPGDKPIPRQRPTRPEED